MQLEFPPEIKLLSRWRPALEPVAKEGLWHWKVYLETTRKLKTAGYAEWGRDDFTPGDRLLNLLIRLYQNREALEAGKLFAGLREQSPAQNLSAEETANLLVKAGWLILWVRLKADGLSPAQIKYYRGPKLTGSLNAAKMSAASKARAWAERLAGKWHALDTSAGPRPDNRDQLTLLEQLKNTSLGLLDKTARHLNGVSPEPPHLPGQPRKAFDPANLNNFFGLTLEFWLALAGAISASPKGFDWKEIGAGYHQAIGGSKVFDRQRDNLVLFTEELFNVSLAETGLISRGSLYSIYLAGSLIPGGPLGSGDKEYPGDKTYPGGKENICLQAITNIEVEETASFITPANQVMLTENRALLLKMYKSGWLKKRPDILAVGIDGRLRTAHKRLLNLIAENSQIARISAWVDTDTAGIEIGAALAALFPGITMVLPPAAGQKEKTLPYPEWVHWLAQHAEYGDTEQEEFLGNASLWETIWPAPESTPAP